MVCKNITFAVAVGFYCTVHCMQVQYAMALVSSLSVCLSASSSPIILDYMNSSTVSVFILLIMLFHIQPFLLQVCH